MILNYFLISDSQVIERLGPVMQECALYMNTDKVAISPLSGRGSLPPYLITGEWVVDANDNFVNFLGILSKLKMKQNLYRSCWSGKYMSALNV